MKKYLLILMSIFLSTIIISCDKAELNDETYYGVAGFVDIGEDLQSPLSINIPEIGWVVIPNMEIDACKDGEHIDNYEVQEGDLLKIYFENASDITILESFPAQFGVNPTSIDVFNNNDIYIERQEDNMWVFDIPLNGIEIENTFLIEDIDLGENLYFDKYQVLDKEMVESFLCEVILTSRTLERLTFLIENSYIDEVLEFYYTNDIVVCPTNYFD